MRSAPPLLHRVIGFLLLFLIVFNTSAKAQGELTVFAAASLTNAISEIAKIYTETTNIPVQLSFASSSTLARQIEAGAPADVFLSANPQWMDYLEKRGLVQPGSRVNVIGNRLALIGKPGATNQTSAGTVTKKLFLSHWDDSKWMAIGDPDHVPAGIYGKEALQSLNIWQESRRQLALTDNVRGALVLVERGEANLAVVYQSDAQILPPEFLIGLFDERDHSEILYPFAITKGGQSDHATSFLSVLQSPKGREILDRAGFTVPESNR